MNLSRKVLIGTLTAFLLAGCSDKPSTESDLWVGMIMTKNQRASSTPTDSGILIRNEDTNDWRRFGPTIMIVSGVTVDPSNPETVFLACGNGIARSIDGGETWRLVSTWKESDVMQVVIDPTDGDRVYAASAWGVTISTDGGDSWTASNSGFPENFIRGISVDSRKPERLLAATSTGLFESLDQATSWTRVPSFPEVAAMRLRQSTSNPDLWLAGTEEKGAWISSDNGNSWKPTAPDVSSNNVYAVAINPFDASKLAIGGWSTGAYLSSDGGTSWTKTAGTLPSQNITAMVYDIDEPDRIWVSTFEEGTYFSDDAGSTWNDSNLDGAYVYDLGFISK